MSEDDTLEALYSVPILVVDDDAISRIFIERSLRGSGFSHISVVSGGLEALEHIKRFPPELIVLDIHMQDLNGLDCCKWIREQPHLGDLPVLMLTSLTDEKLRYESFASGATDFVSKPIHPQELYARVKVHLQNRFHLKNLQRYKSRLDMELHSARALQAAILPSKEELKEVRERSGLDIASYLDTSSEIGGDFWGMKKLFPHQAALWMVDFSGHGVAAALNAFRFQTYLKEPSPLAVKPGEYLSLLNEKLLQILLRGHFATMFYGIVDTHGNMLHYACACSPNPLILRKDGTVEKLDGCGTPLGICTQTYSTQSVRFDYGDTLVLYSDALIETPKNHNSYITEEQMMELLAAHKGASARQLKEAMLEYFASHTDAPLYDDLTLCLCRRMD